jgi:C-terminal processing protease CtpA/Prc
LNYPDQQIFIKPNKRFNDSFDYSYNGLGIYIVEGAITAVDIMKNSPAEKAGFQEGDIIVAVDNNVSNNIQTYKSILQTANARVRVLVLRNGEPKMLTIKVKSIL